MNEQAATELSSDGGPTMRSTKPPRGSRRQTGHHGAQEPQDGELTTTNKRRRANRFADSGLIPALRLTRVVGRQRAQRKPQMVYDTEHTPGHLRLVRLLLGLALLTLAWAASLLVIALAESLMDVFPQQPSLSVVFGLYILGAIGILWLAVVALALIIVGAFSLTLALTRRDW